MSQTKLLVAWCAALAACGGSGSGGGTSASTAQVEAFNTSTQAISTAVAKYGSNAASMPDQATCTADESAYDGQVRPPLSQMNDLAGRMDHGMDAMGQAMDADMECGAAAMTAELERHASVACASATDMAANQSEAAHHVQVMTAYADHQRIRAGQLGSMMGMSGMMGSGTGAGTTGTCQHHADGSFTLSGSSAAVP